MTKILATIGPSSEGKNLKYFIHNSELLRLNLSHNHINWHKKIIKRIKYINKNKLILVDVPGIKPRTLNKKIIDIKKGQIVKFAYKKNKKDIIEISNPLPKTQKNFKTFYLSDGAFEFKSLGISKNILTGKSMQNFKLKMKKGLNIPYSVYDNKAQEKLYLFYLKMISKLDIDCVGLSFIQDASILLKIKKKYPNLILISKIENLSGYKNKNEIIKYSDAVMIDRGDLAAEVGVSEMFNYSDHIIQETKKNNKPVIIATENLNSLMSNTAPSKSDIVNLEYYLQKNVEFIMLSDETATSINAQNTVKWLKKYLVKKLEKNETKRDILKLEEIINQFKKETLVLFSKKGYFNDKISSSNLKHLILFTENKKLKKLSQLKLNCTSIYTKFPKQYLDKFMYKNIKKYKSSIFKKNDYAYLINVIFPREESRANSISIINKKDFK
ncbi:pyruvate kinase [Candidatus Pelagibacter sp.]|nr:pyruvate kinase [Candidatus Pelagibacter sp.]